MKFPTRWLIPKPREKKEFNIGLEAKPSLPGRVQYIEITVQYSGMIFNMKLTEAEAKELRSLLDASIADICRHLDSHREKGGIVDSLNKKGVV